MTGIPDELVEKAAAAMVHLRWPMTEGVYRGDRQVARAALEAVGLPALLERAEAADTKVWPDDYGWADLMTLLDEHWPGDIFGDTDTPLDNLRGELKHDAGVRIVALLRWVDALAAKVAELEVELRKHKSPKPGWTWGECPVCHRRLSVSPSGLMRAHPESNPAHRCPGTHQAPVEGTLESVGEAIKGDNDEAKRQDYSAALTVGTEGA